MFERPRLVRRDDRGGVAEKVAHGGDGCGERIPVRDWLQPTRQTIDRDERVGQKSKQHGERDHDLISHRCILREHANTDSNEIGHDREKQQQPTTATTKHDTICPDGNGTVQGKAIESPYIQTFGCSLRLINPSPVELANTWGVDRNDRAKRGGGGSGTLPAGKDMNRSRVTAILFQ